MKPLRSALVLLVCLALFALPPAWAQEQVERPSAMKLFPYETLAFVRVAHARQMMESFRDTSTGRMLKDPQIQPFLQDTWQLAGDQFNEQASEDVGLQWEDLARLPQGEVAVGLVDRGKGNPGVLVLADFDGEQADADYLFERMTEKWTAMGMVIEEEQLDGETLTVVRRGDDRSTSFGYLLKDTCVIASDDETLLKQMLDRWAGRTPIVPLVNNEPGEDEAATDDEAASDKPLPGELPLADNPHFVTILRECSMQLDEPPQVVLFADPLGLLRAFGRDNTGARVAMATFPALGIDGLLAVGGTSSMATDKWDSVTHLHVLLENPRAEVLTLLRFKEGDITPPDFVPAGAYSYSTLHVDAAGIFERLNQLVDKFRYEGAFRETIDKNISQRLDIDFEDVLINNLAGRVTMFTGFDEPRRIAGEQRAVVAVLDEPDKMKDALDSIAEKFEDRFEAREFGGVEYHAFTPSSIRDTPEEERPFSPCFCVLDESVVFCSSTSLLESMIEAKQGTRPRLADSISYKVLQSRIERLTRGKQLALLYYQDTMEAIRHWYEISQGDQARDGLKRMSEHSPLAGDFLGILEAHELPPADALEKYFPPSGGYLIDTDNGLHFMTFELRTDSDDSSPE